MVNTLEIVGLVLMLVMVVSGMIGIVVSIYYIKTFGPMMKTMVRFYSKMIVRAEKELMEDEEA